VDHEELRCQEDECEHFDGKRCEKQGFRPEAFCPFKLDALKAKCERYCNALKNTIALGHNDDCFFCGFKDKAANEAIGRKSET